MKIIYTIAITSAIAFCSCEKMVEIAPPQYQLIDQEVFRNENTANAAIEEMYLGFNSLDNFGSAREVLATGMCADEIIAAGAASVEWDQFQENRILFDNSWASRPWPFCYSQIYRANAALQALQDATYEKRDQFRAEALFVRAYRYLELINLWGDVPFLTTTEISITATAPRTVVQTIYDAITADLEEAYRLLPIVYDHAANNKVRANKWAAAALLARVYLYQNKWTEAEQYATEVINSNAYQLADAPNSVFLPNSEEAIFQAFPAPGGTGNNWMALYFSSQGGTNICITNHLANAFEANDKRKTDWLYTRVISGNTYYATRKYTRFAAPVTEYVTLLRLAEAYLIRAEARAEQDDLDGSAADLNLIRNRANVGNTTASTKPGLLLDIEHERRVELFAEWCHRWFDLKRTGRATEVLGVIKPDWQETDELWPIPMAQLNNNPHLTQNPGYH